MNRGNYIPSITQHEFSFRSQSHSKDLNELQKETLQDVLELYDGLCRCDLSYNYLHRCLEAEQVSFERKTNEILTKVRELQLENSNLKLQQDELRIMEVPSSHWCKEYPTTAVCDDASSSILPGILTSISKVHVSNVNDMLPNIIPESLQVYLGPDTFQEGQHIKYIEDNDPKNMFVKDKCWMRYIETDDTVETIENEVVVALPEDIMTTRLCNEIILNAFPYGDVDIKDIAYRSDGAWKTIPGFVSHSQCMEIEEKDAFNNKTQIHVIQDAVGLRFTFPDILVSQLKIKLRLRHYQLDAEQGIRKWYLGIRNLSINYNTYKKSNSVFYQRFDFKETDANIQIYDAGIVYNNQMEGMDFSVSKEYFSLDDTGLHRISETCPFALSGHSVIIKYTIIGATAAPNIARCNVRYKLT